MLHRAKLWGALALGSALTLGTVRAEAMCSCFVEPVPSVEEPVRKQLSNSATRVVLMRWGTRTVLSMSNDYDGPPQNFAMVVPVPVVLQKENVKTLPKDVFNRIDQLSAPRLVEYWEQDPCQVMKHKAEMRPMPAPMAPP